MANYPFSDSGVGSLFDAIQEQMERVLGNAAHCDHCQADASRQSILGFRMMLPWSSASSPALSPRL